MDISSRTDKATILYHTAIAQYGASPNPAIRMAAFLTRVVFFELPTTKEEIKKALDIYFIVDCHLSLLSLPVTDHPIYEPVISVINSSHAAREAYKQLMELIRDMLASEGGDIPT